MRQESRSNIDPHLTNDQFRAYQERSLAPAERIEVSRHLKDCDSCRAGLNAIVAAPSAAAINKLFAPDTDFSEHLTYAETVAYVEGKTNPQERAILADHIRVCLDCQEQVEDLRSFSAYLSTATVRTDIPLPPRSFLQRWADWTAQHPASLLAWSATPLLVAGLLIVVLRSHDAVPVTDRHLAEMAQALKDRDSVAMAEKARAEAREAEAMQKARAWEQEKLDLTQNNAKFMRNKQEADREIAKLRGRIDVTKTQLTVAQAQVQRLQQPGLYQDNKGNLKYRREVTVDAGNKNVIIASSKTGLFVPTNKLKPLQSAQPDKMVVLGPSRNPGDTIRLDQPDATLLLSQYPRFVWDAVEKAQQYLVTIRKMNGPHVAKVRLEKYGNVWRVTTTMAEENTKEPTILIAPVGNEWQVPSTRLLFQLGQAYEWQVKAYAGANQEEEPIKKSPVGKFQIVDATVRQKMQAAQARYAASPLLLGIVYASKGLVAEARQQFKEQLRQSPGDQSAQRFLRELEQKSVSEVGPKL